jgi:hypothetical protein
MRSGTLSRGSSRGRKLGLGLGFWSGRDRNSNRHMANGLEHSEFNGDPEEVRGIVNIVDSSRRIGASTAQIHGGILGMGCESQEYKIGDIRVVGYGARSSTERMHSSKSESSERNMM